MANPVREYDWGSTGALATLEGREPSGRPEAERHPDDPLVVAPLLLRLHRLQPGQPMYLPNGVPHAYLSGVGVEIMASSDNVVRGGLTSKRVDSQALADLLDPDAAPLLAVPRTPLSPHEVQWQPPVPEFALSRVVVSNIRVTLSREPSDPVSPEVLLCLNGEGTVSSDGRDVRLRGGQSAFLSAHLNATGAAPGSPLQTPEPYSLPMPDKPLEAIMLVGGQGTRLRPLTLSAPKPLLPTAGVPFLAHLLAWAAAGGVTHVVLATCYKAEMFAAAFGDGSAFGLSIDYVSEDVPLDTAGAIRNAADSLRGTGAADPVVVLNSDILSGHDLSAQIDLHVKADAAVTLHLVEADDPSRFGVVPTDGTGRVMAFLEKTPNPVTNRINAGCYVFRRDVIGQIPAGRRVSVERDTFPGLIEAGELVMGYHESAYWLDVGTPQTFVRGSCDLVLGRLAAPAVPGPPGDMLLLAGALVEPDASVSGGSVVGVGASVGSGATVYGSVLFDSATVGEGAVVRGSVVGRGAVVAPGAVLDDAVVGDGAYVGPGNELARGIRVWPGMRLEPTSVRFSSDV